MAEENELEKLKNEINYLEGKLQQKKTLLKELEKSKKNYCPYTIKLSTDEVSRYSRQMIIPQIGLHGQIDLKESSILIVGIGGLGCPAALYLAAAGVGNITLVDYDLVEITNLHRQILHSESTIGIHKVQSACSVLQSINSNIKIVPLHMSADSDSLKNLFTSNKYDVVLDGSDNVATRYLLNDVCVLNKVPLVSGSALQLEGQLTVYNYDNGPCYRCLFPIPPPPSTVTNCGDGGVLGPVPGVIGVLQALETIKILTRMDDVLSGRLLIFDASTTSFMNVKLRQKKENCDVCGLNPKIKDLIDYEQFCGSKADDKVTDINILTDVENITVKEFSTISSDAIVIDVRPKVEYEICKLRNTINLPYTYITTDKNLEDVTNRVNSLKSQASKVYFMCRRGNDSQRAVKYLKDVLIDKTGLVNIKGGLLAYAKEIDSSFPIY